MTLAGTVPTADGCTVLDTCSQRWVLLGDRSGRLRAGERATVRERPVAVPAGCHADHALQVTVVS